MIHRPWAASSALMAAPTVPLLLAVTVKSPARPRAGPRAPRITASQDFIDRTRQLTAAYADALNSRRNPGTAEPEAGQSAGGR
jgi:hypothetical protein